MQARKRILRYAVPFAVWSVPAFFLTVVGMLREENTSLRDAFLSEGVAWCFWALVTPLILDIARRYPLETVRRLRFILLHLGAALGFGFLEGLLAAFTYLVFVTQPPPDLDPGKFVTNAVIVWTFFGTIFYAMIATVGFVLSYHVSFASARLRRAGSRRGWSKRSSVPCACSCIPTSCSIR